MNDMRYGDLSPVISVFKAYRYDAEVALADGCLTLEQFCVLQRLWSTEAFGPSPPRGPIGPLKHLAKEVNEAIDAATELANWGEGPSPFASVDALAERNSQTANARAELLAELVDCTFLVFDAVWRAGFGLTELRRGLGRKLIVNRGRIWPKMAPDQAVEHDRSKDVPHVPDLGGES